MMVAILQLNRPNRTNKAARLLCVMCLATEVSDWYTDLERTGTVIEIIEEGF